MIDNSVRKAVSPIAGLSTRSIPATKASPKELLAIPDKPLTQKAVEAGISDLIFVTDRSRIAIEVHFDKTYELELAAQNKTEPRERIADRLLKGVSCIFIRQPEAPGLGYAVLCAKHAVGNEGAR
jgi:UTP--glucose-1-phosphate uridylyltransferase